MAKTTNKQTIKPSHDPKFFEFAQNVATRIQALRKSNGDTMETLATACGVTRGTIHKLEHPAPQEDMPLATLFSIAKRYNMSMSDLLFGIEKSPTPTVRNEDEIVPRWFDNEDFLALSVLNEVLALHIRADLAEQACLYAHEEHVLEVLAKHSAKLRKQRYSILKNNL
jgi:transcriptional regulator with XRE-family HTH domain